MPYIAQKRLKVGHDQTTDQPVFREIGDEVPEAETWTWQIRAQYERTGYIKETVAPSPAAGRSKGK